MKKTPSATSSERNASQLGLTPKMAGEEVRSRYFTSISNAFCTSATALISGNSVAIALASSKSKVGGTLTSVGMPRVRPPPGRTIMASKVPSMFLKRCMVSRFVASPSDERTASEAIPTRMPSIIRLVRKRYRRRLRMACNEIFRAFTVHLPPGRRRELDRKPRSRRVEESPGTRMRRPRRHGSLAESCDPPGKDR